MQGWGYVAGNDNLSLKNYSSQPDWLVLRIYEDAIKKFKQNANLNSLAVAKIGAMAAGKKATPMDFLPFPDEVSPLNALRMRLTRRTARIFVEMMSQNKIPNSILHALGAAPVGNVVFLMQEIDKHG